MFSHKLEKVRVKTEIEIAQEISAQVNQAENPFIGFKLWNGDGYSGSVRIAEELKRILPHVSIFAGGPQVKFFKDFIFGETKVFDALAIGDGEATIVPLAEASLSTHPLSDVPNIFYRSTEGTPLYTSTRNIFNLNELPFPIYDPGVYSSMEGDQKINMIVVEDRRGCDNACNFCAHPSISGRNPRTKTPQRIVDEFEYSQKKYGISNFRLGGSSTPGKSLTEIAEEIMRRDLHLNFTAFMRAKDADTTTFSNLKEAGLYSLFIGIESGSQGILDAMNKKVSKERIAEVIGAGKRAGIFMVGSLIYPAPFDTADTRAETVSFLTETQPDSIPLQFLGVYPGTEYARHPERYNIEMLYPSTMDKMLASLGLKPKPKFNDPEILRYLLEYKIRLLFPPRYWDPLPWKVNGLSYKQFAAEAQKLYEELKQKEFLMSLTDPEALMAHLTGVTAKGLYNQTFFDLFTGNWRGMEDLIKKVNHANK
ncbi:hypothetical protein A2282_07670 [candidate division WOR-1 bacterium RIFOXYA12_FULL_36_13]|nr:MAG: hypothetical protein A2282_07670 [candidate division WOR-1 bacterium RIFOXYA12_FULL_36_13]